ncbi:FAD-binding oxidoreductase [Mesorhizobium sp. M7A.F.Ca.US.006.04.2.1]|uniref:FAD-binding oxidoreductase n=1 Tax=unclassified Mesorhizobium TaxID=325217 RepID=UPI000FCA4500|nr:MULTISPECIES: FAD-binding oxidoreductase [unclassified Mesorhizobium]MBZ9721877.1 FAD-binding oxidoreductase [Mesorhizobium sp. AD1-1]RUX70884.1 FAD-binding oxidoreductase [Mesorhizobium sp. M7A.F.Ca.US.005.03.1.1]RUY14744.1 FAD-binding oxidoreductase [Mesorhizobium sp. M7A.F.Ca.US.005.03.2.1]RUY29885.1 FAD-binding oxidoreductase [Mesorhizobium sp. M7A.F.Ca.US.001.04.2.1]RUY36439.1 FAD-binding oxidoreductase [Mesorhizobium sp. M7A.F.Ca.US.001.04.1.1]
MDVSALKRDLEGLKVDDNPAIVQQKSRDFYWYSPVLKQQLDHVTGDLIVTPKNEAELIRVLAACHRHGVPVTPRGSGTGNYGQAMPLSGGVVLNLAEMNEIKSIAPGRVVTGPGAILADIDKATRAHSGQELRLSPSTYNTASIGGFIAGGSGGVGSINFGGLRDFGNVLRLRVVTMEAEPKALELTGADLHKVTHAYGTNGIISEVEMPLTAAYDWIDVIVGFDAFMDAARYGNALACQDGILTKLITPIAAPVPQLYFKRHQKFLSDGQSICLVMVAQHGLDAFLAFTRRAGGEVIYNAATATPDEKKGLPPAYELAWNHTTLRALRVDPSITYLQSLYPFPNQLALVEKMDAMFPGEVFSHLEFVRLDGNITCFGLPLVKFTTEARLDEIVRLHEANGCPIFNPHRYTLEEGGMKQTDAVQLAFKRETDPQGLLNPGKMIAWENPDYDYRSGRTFLFKGLQKVG